MFLCLALVSKAQENIFVDTNPVNNIDSLETWLIQNPKPNLTRLRNLFKLQKTYLWEANEKSVLEEFGQLSHQLNNSSGIKFYSLLKALRLSAASKSEEAKLYFSKAMNLIESGDDKLSKFICYTYCAMIFLDSKRISDNALSKKYIEKAKIFAANVENPHDKLIYLVVNSFIETYSISTNQAKLSVIFKEANSLMNKNPSTNYAKFTFSYLEMEEKIKAQQYEEGVRIGEQIVKVLDKKSHRLLARNYYPLAICYQRLGLIQKAKWAFEQALIFDKKISKDFVPNQGNTTRYELRLSIFNDFRVFAIETSNTKLVNSLADSIILYKNLEKKELNDKLMLEIQNQYNLSKSENEKKIAVILAEQKAKENAQLGLYLASAIILLSLMIYLYFQLRKSNRRLKKLNLFRDQFYTLFTHDIRRSINSLATAGGMLNNLIQNNKTDEINIITKQIDWMAYHTLQLVDNILDWGINNGYKIDTKPQQFDISEEIRNTFNKYKSAIVTKKIEVQLEVEDFLIINTSQSCFDIIFRNMLGNAFSHTPKAGNIRITAKSYKQDSVRVSIENTVDEIDYPKINYINQVFKDKQLPAVGENGLGLGVVLMKTYADKSNTKLEASITSKNTIAFSITVLTNNLSS